MKEQLKHYIYGDRELTEEEERKFNAKIHICGWYSVLVPLGIYLQYFF